MPQPRSDADGPAAASGGPEPVALFGTSADPPTHGHRALLEGLLRHYPHVATWASDNPLKRHTAPLPLRMALLQALVEGIGDPRLSLVQELSSPWAMQTLERARERWPQRQPVFVIGSDLIGQVPRWRSAEQWLPGCRLAIAPRQGWPVQARDLERLRQLGARTELLDLQVPASASSGVRARPDPAQVPAELLPLLRRHDPYGLLSPRCASPSPSSTS
jgi:nicotinate-nucleotide adenylyltransferase